MQEVLIVQACFAFTDSSWTLSYLTAYNHVLHHQLRMNCVCINQAVSVASQIISVSKEAVLARWSGASSTAATVSDGTTTAATVDAASYLAV